MDDNSQFMNCVKCVYIIFMCEIKKITEITRSGISLPINLYEIYVFEIFFDCCCDHEKVGDSGKYTHTQDFKTKHSRLRNS